MAYLATLFAHALVLDGSVNLAHLWYLGRFVAPISHLPDLCFGFFTPLCCKCYANNAEPGGLA